MKCSWILTILTIITLLASPAAAQVPEILSLQGQLNGPDGLPVDGSQTVSISLYLVDTLGTPVWTEAQTVSFDSGKFTVLLGTVEPLALDFSQQYWMGISIETDPELTPRIPLTSTAYSIRSKFVEGLTADNVRQFWALIQTMSDADGDGYDRISAGGNDCDDLDPFVHPGALDVCDGLDNDCSGVADDGCGSPPNVAQVGCVADQCVIVQCEPGFLDDNGVFVDGCETQCAPELCDGIDNDCNPGTPDGADEPLLNMPCDGPDADLCEEGVWTCGAEASMECTDFTGDTQEICDGIDNDCDGDVDEMPSCGADPMNALWVCVAAQCVITCENGFFDVNDNPIDGCECEFTSAVDDCDGIDNDCDGQVDEDCVP